MPTFVYMTRCDGCGQCVDICPSDIMHIDTTYRRAFNIEPNMCWECYSCVKACPQFAIDCRGYADFAPLGHSVRVRREEEKATISWKIKFRDGREKDFVSPIRTTGIVTAPAACWRFECGVAKEHGENQLLRISVPSGDHSPGDLALSPVHAQLSRRRGFARRARNCNFVRDSPTLGESFRADHSGGIAQAPSQTAFDLASGRGLSENRWAHGLPVARRRRRSAFWGNDDAKRG